MSLYDLINKIKSDAAKENDKRKKALETAYPIAGQLTGIASGGLAPAIDKIIAKTPRITEQVGYQPLSAPESVPDETIQPVGTLEQPEGSLAGTIAKTIARVPGQAASGLVDIAAFGTGSKNVADISKRITQKNYELFPSDAPSITTMDDFRRASWADLGIVTLEGTGSLASSMLTVAPLSAGVLPHVAKLIPAVSKLASYSPKFASFIEKMGGVQSVANKTASIFGSVGLEAGGISSDYFEKNGEMPEKIKTLAWAIPAGILEGLSIDRLFGGEARLVNEVGKKLGAAAAAEAKANAGGAAAYIVSKAKDMGFEGGTEWLQNLIEEMGVKNLEGAGAGQAITSTVTDPNAQVRGGIAGLSGAFGAGGMGGSQDLAGAIFKANKTVQADPTVAKAKTPVVLPPIKQPPVKQPVNQADVGGSTSVDDAKAMKRKAALRSGVLDAIQSMSETGDAIPDDQVNQFIFDAFGKNLEDMDENELQQAYDAIMEQGAMGQTVSINQSQPTSTPQVQQEPILPQDQIMGEVSSVPAFNSPVPVQGLSPVQDLIPQQGLVETEIPRREVQFPQYQPFEDQAQLAEPQRRLPEPLPRSRPVDIQQAIESAKRLQLPAPQPKLPAPEQKSLQQAIERATKPKQLPSPVVEQEAESADQKDRFMNQQEVWQYLASLGLNNAEQRKVWDTANKTLKPHGTTSYGSRYQSEIDEVIENIESKRVESKEEKSALKAASLAAKDNSELQRLIRNKEILQEELADAKNPNKTAMIGTKWESNLWRRKRVDLTARIKKANQAIISEYKNMPVEQTRTEPAAPVAPKDEPAFTVRPSNGGFAVISPTGEQVSWGTSKDSAEKRAGELNAGQSDKIAAKGLNIGDKVSYNGEEWEVGFINELSHKGTVRLQKSGVSGAKQLNYIPADQVTKIAPQQTQSAETKPIEAKPVQKISSENAGMLQNAAKLKESAQKLLESAEKEMYRDRQTNTNKRSREAAQAVDSARGDQAFAKTAIKLSEAMERGEIKHLSKVRSRPDLEVFRRLAVSTRQKYATKNNIGYEKSLNLTLTDEMIDSAAIFENPYLYRSRIQDLANTLEKTPGMKADAKAVQRIADTARSDNNYVTVNSDAVEKLNEVITKAQRAGIKSYEVKAIADSLDEYNRLKKLGISNTDQLKLALKEYIGLSVKKAEESKLAKAERALTGKTFEGFDFFPTPTGLAKRIAEELDIQPGMKVLEPSAGKGDLADAVKAAQPEAVIKVIEPLGDLREILTEKGYELADNNFDDFQTTEKFDRIIMNPPFSKNRDIKHVKKAYELLAPGGKLMAITSNHFTFASDKESVAFREWLDEVGGTAEALGQAFMGKDAFRQTGVNSQLITIEKAAEVKPVEAKADSAKYIKDTAKIDLKELSAVISKEIQDSLAKGTPVNGDKFFLERMADALTKMVIETDQLEAARKQFKDMGWRAEQDLVPILDEYGRRKMHNGRSVVSWLSEDEPVKAKLAKKTIPVADTALETRQDISDRLQSVYKQIEELQDKAVPIRSDLFKKRQESLKKFFDRRDALESRLRKIEREEKAADSVEAGLPAVVPYSEKQNSSYVIGDMADAAVKAITKEQWQGMATGGSSKFYVVVEPAGERKNGRIMLVPKDQKITVGKIWNDTPIEMGALTKEQIRSKIISMSGNMPILGYEPFDAGEKAEPTKEELDKEKRKMWRLDMAEKHSLTPDERAFISDIGRNDVKNAKSLFALGGITDNRARLFIKSAIEAGIVEESFLDSFPEQKPVVQKAVPLSQMPTGSLTETERITKDQALKKGEVFGKIIDYGKIFPEFNKKHKPWRIVVRQEKMKTVVKGKETMVPYTATVLLYGPAKRAELSISDGEFYASAGNGGEAIDFLNDIFKNFKPEYITGKAPETRKQTPDALKSSSAPSQVWGKKPSSAGKVDFMMIMPDGYVVDGKWAVMTKAKPPIERASEIRPTGAGSTVQRTMTDFDMNAKPKFKIPLMGRKITDADVWLITDGTEALILTASESSVAKKGMIGVSPITDRKITGKETFYSYDQLREIQSLEGELSYVETTTGGTGHFVTEKGDPVVVMPFKEPKIITERRQSGRPLYSIEYAMAEFIAKHGKAVIQSGVDFMRQGAVKFSEWSSLMAGKFGQAIQSSAKEIYDILKGSLAKISYAVENFVDNLNIGKRGGGDARIATDILSIIDKWQRDGRAALLQSAYSFIDRGGGSLVQWVKDVAQNLRQFAAQAWKDARKIFDISGGKGAFRRGGGQSLASLAASIRKANDMATGRGKKPLPRSAANELINEATTASYNLGEADAQEKAAKSAEAAGARADKKLGEVKVSAERKLDKVKKVAGARYNKIRKQLKEYKELVKRRADITFEVRKNLRLLAIKLPKDIRWKTMKAITEAKTMNQVSKAVDLIDRLYEDFQRADAVKEFKKSLRDLNKLRPQFKVLAEGLAFETKEGEISAPAVYKFMDRAIDLLGKSDTVALPDAFLSQAEFLLKTRPNELNRRTITFLADSFNTIKFLSGLENERIFDGKNKTVEQFTKDANADIAKARKMTNDEGVIPQNTPKGIMDRVFNIWATQYGDFAEIAGQAFKKVFYDDVKEGKDKTVALRLAGKDAAFDAMRSVGIDPEDGKTIDWYEEKITMEVSGGKVETTRDEKMNLIANLLDKSTNYEIIDRASRKKGPSFGSKIQGAGFILESDPDTTHHLTEDESIALVESLSAEERIIVDAMRDFINTDLKRGFNAAMVDLAGYEKALRNDYWPRKRKSVTPMKLSEGFKEWLKGSLESAGITKERTTSKLPVMIGKITETYNNHLRTASNIAGLAVPIRNINMALGKNKLKENLDARFGKEFVERIQKQLEVISEVDRPVKGFFSETVRKLLDNIAIGFLGLNPRAGAKQFGGLFTLSTEIEYKYIKQAFWAKFDKDVEAEMYAWSPALRDRYDSSASKLITPTFEKDSGLFRDRDEVRKNKAMFLLEKGDKAVSLVAWEAVKAKLKETQPDLKGDDLLRAVAKETQSLISKTQNVSDTMDMSGMAIDSRTDALAKALTMFQSQNNTILNIVRRATIKWNRGDIEWPELTKILIKALMFNALWSSLVGRALSVTLYKQLYRKDATAASLAVDTAFDVAEDAVGILPGANLFSGSFRKIKDMAKGTTFGGPAKIENVVESVLNTGANSMLSALGVITQWGEVYESGKREGQYKSRKQFELAIEGAVRSLLPLIGKSSYPITETWNLLAK